MPHPITTVFVWNDFYQEKTLVAASASSDSIEIYYTLESKCSGFGTSCTVSSHTWYGETRRYLVEEFATD